MWDLNKSTERYVYIYIYKKQCLRWASARRCLPICRHERLISLFGFLALNGCNTEQCSIQHSQSRRRGEERKDWTLNSALLFVTMEDTSCVFSVNILIFVSSNTKQDFTLNQYRDYNSLRRNTRMSGEWLVKFRVQTILPPGFHLIITQ